MHRRLARLTLPLISFICPLVGARSYNVTIDDQYGDPTNGQMISYSPSSSWNNGQGCDTCTAKPSPPSNAYMGTWKDATFYPTDSSGSGQIIQASVPFSGTAVYVNCILTGSSDRPDGNSDMIFILDGNVVGSFLQPPNNDTSYHFGVTVFSKTGLMNGMHTISLESGHAGNKTLVLLDSITYTEEVEDQTSVIISLSNLVHPPTSSVGAISTGNSKASSSSSDASVIAGAVVGGIVAMTAIIASAFLCYRRQRRREGGVRVVLDSSDVPNPISGHSAQLLRPNYPSAEIRVTPFALHAPSAPTLAPGDSVSQVSSSRTSDWTSNASNGRGRQKFRERTRQIALSEKRLNSTTMKVQNATDADIHELDAYGEMKPPVYMSSRYGQPIEKGKS